jgi:hypothetical protein
MDLRMKKKRGKNLEQWLGRLPGAEEIPFQIDRRGLYRVSDLYKGYNPKKPESLIRAFDHVVYQWTLDPTTSKARRLRPEEVIAERLHDVAIGQGIDRFLSSATKRGDRPAVGFMGGHDTDPTGARCRAGSRERFRSADRRPDSASALY